MLFNEKDGISHISYNTGRILIDFRADEDLCEIEENFEGSGEPLLFVAATTSDKDCTQQDLYVIAGKFFMYINDLAAQQNPDIALSSEESVGGLYKSIKCAARIATDGEALYGLAVNVDLFSSEDEKNLIEIMNQ